MSDIGIIDLGIVGHDIVGCCIIFPAVTGEQSLERLSLLFDSFFIVLYQVSRLPSVIFLCMWYISSLCAWVSYMYRDLH